MWIHLAVFTLFLPTFCHLSSSSLSCLKIITKSEFLYRLNYRQTCQNISNWVRFATFSIHIKNSYTVPSQQITGKKTPTFLRVHCHRDIYIYIEIQVGSYLNNDNLIDYRSSVDTSFSVGIVAKMSCRSDACLKFNSLNNSK